MNEDIILVIDDEANKDYAKDCFQSIENIIFSIGRKHLIVDHGEAGIDAVKKDVGRKHIKLVILDNEFAGQSKQGGELLKEIKTIREDLPVIVLSKLPRGEQEGRNKEKLPASKSAKRLGASLYIEKEEFLKKPDKVKNLILSILEKPPYKLILDCAAITLDIQDSKGSILKNLVTFNDIGEDWKDSIYPFNEDHFLFKLNYVLAMNPSRRVNLEKVFKLVKDREDTSQSQGVNTYIVPFSFGRLKSSLEDVRLPENLRLSWGNILSQFEEDPYQITAIKQFLKENNRNDLTQIINAYEDEISKLSYHAAIQVNKLINEFNTKIRNNSNGKINALLKGRGPGRYRAGEANIFTLCIDHVTINNDPIDPECKEEFIERPSVQTDAMYVTKDELKKELEALKAAMVEEFKKVIAARKKR